MFGNRRLAKRSIIGTKVCALWQDGRFYPGVIQNHPADDETPRLFEPKYTIRFDDGYQRQVSVKDIVGPGFNTVSNFTLKHGQKVYLTLNGREVPGIVADHDSSTDEVIVNVQIALNGEELELSRKSDEIRLMESRKSARLVDQDTDYSKLADLNVTESKKRTVSHVIDVPSKSQRYRRPSPDDEDRENAQNEDEDVEMMDETIAAMVLTSLSTSPASPKFPTSLTEFSGRNMLGQVPLSSSANSSGFHSERSDPSPPLPSHLSESAPASTSGGMFFGSFPRDEGLVLEENEELDEEDEDDEPKRKRIDQGLKKTMFKCTWKGCSKIHNTCSGIEKHVRTAHLGRNENDFVNDHEEEFYYTEIEVNVENVTQTFSDITFTSSPPENFSDFGRQIPDHDYQKKDHRQNMNNPTASSVPSGGFFQSMMSSGSLPISMPQIKRSLSWQNNNTNSSPSGSLASPSSRSNKPTPQERLQQHQAQSPKSHLFSSTQKQSSSHKKPRSEVRKCRKVYGMENRDMWCTQCKWKKACSRFTD